MKFLTELRAQQAIKNGRYADAISLLCSKLEKYPQDAVFLALLAHCYEWNGEFQLAIDAADSTLKILPDYPEMLILAARCSNALSDNKRTYGYVCQLLDHPVQSITRPPNWTVRLFRPIEKLISRRGVSADVIDAISDMNRHRIKDYEWATRFRTEFEQNKRGPRVEC